MKMRVKKRWLWLPSLAIAILSWELIAFVIDEPGILPRFSMVMFSFYELGVVKGYIIPDTLMSLYHFGIGLGAAFCVAVPLGIAMGWFENVFRAIDPIIEILRPIPPLAWIPLAIAWFKLSPIAAGFIIFLGIFFPILIDTYTGFRDVPKVLVETSKVLGCAESKKQIRYVAFPYALPSIATGTRVGMGVGWMCVVAAEMFGVSKSGLGYRLFSEFNYWNQLDYIIAYMLLLGFISLCLDRLFRYIVDERLFRWKKGIVK